jgi:hypothetical protein
MRDIELTDEDLTRVIECSVCEARFGPLVPPPPVRIAPPPPPPPPAPAAPVDPAASKPRIRVKKTKPKPRTRILPIVLGVFLGLAGTAAMLGAVFVMVRHLQQPGAINSPPATPARSPGAPK